MRSVILLLILMIAPVARATAQAVRPGDRVRVVHRCPRPQAGDVRCVEGEERPPITLAGTVVAFDRDTLMMSVPGEEALMVIPLAFVTQIARHRTGTRAGSGAGIGFLVGGMGGAVAGGAACASDPWFEDAAGGCALIGFGVLGGAGALVGAIIGSMITTTRWETVPLERVRVDVARQRGGQLGLGLTVAF